MSSLIGETLSGFGFSFASGILPLGQISYARFGVSACATAATSAIAANSIFFVIVSCPFGFPHADLDKVQSSLPGWLVKERSGEVAFGGVGKNGDDRLPRSEALRELKRGKDVRPGGDAGEQPLLRGEVARAAERTSSVTTQMCE